MSDEEHTYRTKSGKVLTEADIEALADEAERGYDIEKIMAENRRRAQEHYEAGGSHPAAIYAMLRANLRAAELRNEAMGLNPAMPPNHMIMHGAPTHSCAHLLNALEEDGWRVVPKDTEAVQRVEPEVE